MAPIIYRVLRPPDVGKDQTVLQVTRSEAHRWKPGDRLAIVARKRVNVLQVAQGRNCSHHKVVSVAAGANGIDSVAVAGGIPSHDWRLMRLVDVEECEHLTRNESDEVYTRVAGADTLVTGNFRVARMPGIRISQGARAVSEPLRSGPRPRRHVPLWAFNTVSAALLVTLILLLASLVWR